MSKRAALAKNVVILCMRHHAAPMSAEFLRLAGVGAVILMMGCGTVLSWKKVGQIIQRKLYRAQIAPSSRTVWAANLHVPTGRIRPIDMLCQVRCLIDEAVH